MNDWFVYLGTIFLGGVLILVEVIVPGGVLGAIGALLVLAGWVLVFWHEGLGPGLVVSLASIVVLGICLYVEFRLLPRTRFGRRMFLQTSVTGRNRAVSAEESVIGKECEALTALAPSGVVLLDGKKYEAFSQSGFIDQGTRLRINGLDNFRLIVSKL